MMLNVKKRLKRLLNNLNKGDFMSNKNKSRENYHKEIKKFHRTSNNSCRSCGCSLNNSRHHFFCNDCHDKRYNILNILKRG